MTEQLAYLGAALMIYIVLYWIQKGDKPKAPGADANALVRSIGPWTNMGYGEIFTSGLCFMLFNAFLAALPANMLPMPTVWSWLMRYFVFMLIGIAAQSFLKKQWSIETAEWMFGAITPQVVVWLVLNTVPGVTQVYMFLIGAFFGVSGGIS